MSFELHVHAHCEQHFRPESRWVTEMSLVKRSGLPALSPHAIPAGAYRLIIDFCGRDPSFCHLIIPHFRDNLSVLLLLSENGQKFIDKRQRPREEDPHDEKAASRLAS